MLVRPATKISISLLEPIYPVVPRLTTSIVIYTMKSVRPRAAGDLVPDQTLVFLAQSFAKGAATKYIYDIVIMAIAFEITAQRSGLKLLLAPSRRTSMRRCKRYIYSTDVCS